jgi:hypothetical protein
MLYTVDVLYAAIRPHIAEHMIHKSPWDKLHLTSHMSTEHMQAFHMS